MPKSLGDRMKAMYSGKGMDMSEEDDSAESPESEDKEYELLGNRLKAAMDSGDGVRIANTFQALMAECQKKM